MKLVRVAHQGHSHYGILQDTNIELLRGDPFSAINRKWISIAANKVAFLPPVSPGKVVAVGLNYIDHAKELGMDFPEEPIIFLKPASSVIGPEATIIRPTSCAELHYEGELAVVIGRKAKNVSEAAAPEYILGYTCANDITARDLQKRDKQWTRAKSFDTFCPLGPYIETEMDPGNAPIATRVNGNLRQESSTAQMIFPIGKLVSFVSQVMTLDPGDVILTGTPSGVGPLQAGDVVEVDIAGIGVLRNEVAEESEPTES